MIASIRSFYQYEMKNKKVSAEDFKQIRTLQDVVSAIEKIVNEEKSE